MIYQINDEFKDGYLGHVTHLSRAGIYLVLISDESVVDYGSWTWYAYKRGEGFKTGSAFFSYAPWESINVDVKHTHLKTVEYTSPGEHFVCNLINPFSQEGIPWSLS